MADDSIGPDPGTEDEFDRQLRALTEGSAGRARFHELSAAERAKAGARRAKEARKRAARDASRAERAARQAAGQAVERPPYSMVTEPASGTCGSAIRT